MIGIRVDELKRGPKTFDHKEEFKSMGYNWTSNGVSRAWVKEVETIEEAKAEIDTLKNMGFGATYVRVNGKEYENITAKTWTEQEKEIWKTLHDYKIGK